MWLMGILILFGLRSSISSVIEHIYMQWRNIVVQLFEYHKDFALICWKMFRNIRKKSFPQQNPVQKRCIYFHFLECNVSIQVHYPHPQDKKDRKPITCIVSMQQPQQLPFQNKFCRRKLFSVNNKKKNKKGFNQKALKPMTKIKSKTTKEKLHSTSFNAHSTPAKDEEPSEATDPMWILTHFRWLSLCNKLHAKTQWIECDDYNNKRNSLFGSVCDWKVLAQQTHTKRHWSANDSYWE